jgi:hypothetical protein
LRMWQWNAQIPGWMACTSAVYRSPGATATDVGPARLGQRVAVLGDHELGHAGQVYGVGLEALVEVVDLGPKPFGSLSTEAGTNSSSRAGVKRIGASDVVLGRNGSSRWALGPFPTVGRDRHTAVGCSRGWEAVT